MFWKMRPKVPTLISDDMKSDLISLKLKSGC